MNLVHTYAITSFYVIFSKQASRAFVYAALDDFIMSESRQGLASCRTIFIVFSLDRQDPVVRDNNVRLLHIWISIETSW